jgi:hypothetical protein
MLEEIKEIMEKVIEGQKSIETMESIVEIVEKTDNKKAIDYCKDAVDYCKRELNKLEYELIITMEHYIHEYRINEERNYGPRQD